MNGERLLAAASALGPSCQASEAGHILTMPSPYSDGDLPQIQVRQTDEGWHLDDFGSTHGRLYDRGVDTNDRMMKSLDGIAGALGFVFIDGVLEGSTEDAHLTGALYRFTAALLQAEAVVHLAITDPEKSFADQVLRWVEDLGVDLRPRPSIKGRGRKYKVTALAFRTPQERDRDDGTLLQSVNDQKGLEHAYYIFNSLSEDYPPERLLAVVSSGITKRGVDVAHLAEAGYVTDLSGQKVTGRWLRETDEERERYKRLLTTPTLLDI